MMITHSAQVAGGTGSGLGMLTFERLAIDYRKKYKIGFNIYPFNDHTCNKSNSVVEAYNAMFSTSWLLDHSEYSVVLDNRQIYNLCKRNYLSKQDININTKKSITNVTYHDMNQLMSAIESAFTLGFRFTNKDLFYSDIRSKIWDVVTSFARLHFITCSMAPITKDIMLPKYESTLLVDGYMRQYSLSYKLNLYQDLIDIVYNHYGINHTTYDLLETAFNSENFFVEIDDFDAKHDPVMNLEVTFCGNGFKGNTKEINETIKEIKKNKKVTFVEWCPDDIRTSIFENNKGILNKENDTIVTFQNNSGISKFFRNRICSTVDKMYSQNAYIHWYIGEGMEQSEFSEAREELAFLEKDYLDVLFGQLTDEDDDY